MLSLQVLAKSKLAQSVARLLDGLEGARAVTLTPAVRAVPEIDITVTRLETVGRLGASASEVSVLWSDVIGAAWRQARPIGRYLVFMFAAGVIACYGVTDDNGILIVGARPSALISCRSSQSGSGSSAATSASRGGRCSPSRWGFSSPAWPRRSSASPRTSST